MPDTVSSFESYLPFLFASIQIFPLILFPLSSSPGSTISLFDTIPFSSLFDISLLPSIVLLLSSSSSLIAFIIKVIVGDCFVPSP